MLPELTTLHFKNWERWVARAVVLGFAALAGLSIVCLVWLSESALAMFRGLQGQYPFAPLIWTPLLTCGIVWATRRWCEGAAGSGIPQVLAALQPQTSAEQRPLFVSLRIAVAKVFLTSGGLLAGLSSGREGPAAQVAAGVMHHARRWLPARAAISEHGLIAAGGAAGVAAAFNTPLGGILFAIEQLARQTEHRFSGLLIAAIVLAGLVSVSFHGSSPYFGTIQIESDLSGIWMAATGVVLACGLTGGLFSRTIVVSLAGDGSRVSQLRQRFPVRFAAACGFAVACIGLVSQGSTFGSGYQTTRALLEGQSPPTDVYTLLRAIATWLTAWSGIPGGVFAPALSIGAGIGHDIGQLAGHPHSRTLIALGMVGFLAATTQSPITSFIIVMEMIEGHALVLSLMACALIASTLSRAISPPMYSALMKLQLLRCTELTQK